MSLIVIFKNKELEEVVKAFLSLVFTSNEQDFLVSVASISLQSKASIISTGDCAVYGCHWMIY
jgi:hypothetical protein